MQTNEDENWIFIVLDRPRRMRLDLAAITNFRELTGLEIFSPVVTKTTDYVILSALLWSLFRADDPALNIVTASKLVTSEYLVKIYETVHGRKLAPAGVSVPKAGRN